jgi:competence protein ComEC
MNSFLAPEHPLHTVLPASRLPCIAGTHLDWSGLSIDFLHPPINTDYAQQKTNAVGCVIRLSDTHHSVLLAADIEAAQEARLVDTYGSHLHSDILLAPHHGSKTSSTLNFLHAVNPQHVVIQNGYRNRYGHPHPTVSQRYSDLNITQWRSDIDGAVIVDIDANVPLAPLTLFAWRQQAKRYWHTLMPQASTLRQTADGIEF